MPDQETNDAFADLTFDDIFDAAANGTVEAPTTAAQTASLETTPAPQAPAPTFTPIRTESGTVYNTPEEANRGITEKDRLIESMRMKYIAATGYDPVDGKPVRASQTPQEVNYALEPEALYRDLAEANGNGRDSAPDPKKFHTVMTKLISDSLRPYVPLMNQIGREQVIHEVAKTTPEFEKFLASPEYKSYLEQRPTLKQAIESAEQAPEMAPQLREFYALAYEGARGKSLPEILSAAKQTTATVQPHQTMSSTTSSPPSPGTAPSMATAEGRRAIREQFESRSGNVRLPF